MSPGWPAVTLFRTKNKSFSIPVFWTAKIVIPALWQHELLGVKAKANGRKLTEKLLTIPKNISLLLPNFPSTKKTKTFSFSRADKIYMEMDRWPSIDSGKLLITSRSNTTVLVQCQKISHYCQVLPVTPHELHVMTVVTTFHATGTDSIPIRCTTCGAPDKEKTLIIKR